MLTILESVPVAQFVIGPDHKITFWNRECEHLTGYPANEMIGTDRQWEPFYREKRPVLADLILNNDFEQFLKLYEHKNTAKSKIIPNAWEATDYFEDLGGRPRYLFFLAAPVFDLEGKVTGAIETLLEVSEKAGFEKLLMRSTENGLRKNLKIREALKDPCKFGSLIGKSQAMQEVYELIVKAAATNANVILYGESGTGKELVARAIHDLSSRHTGKFVAVNCGAIPETLIESEFFGHRKGAFTGAHADRPGYLDQADGGTLFLDEAGEISLSMQVKLLRAIEGGEFTAVGSNETQTTDMRIIAATSRDLLGMIRKGLMRDDFFYRIHILPIHIPPLRDRREDIRLLVDYFLKLYAHEEKKTAIPEKILKRLDTYAWPGNVRELQNVLVRYLTLKQLDFPGRPAADPGLLDIPVHRDESPAEVRESLREAVASFEKSFIMKALGQHNWHKSRTASAMGISRKTLFRKMKDFGLMK